MIVEMRTNRELGADWKERIKELMRITKMRWEELRKFFD